MTGTVPASGPGHRERGIRAGLAAWLLVCLPVASAFPGTLPECVYVSSYHPGYSWSDRLEQALRDTLDTRCHLTSVYLDTKRRKDAGQMREAAAAAMALIREVEPAVVITSDDNAAKYLIVPHLKGARTPVVFSGINWTVEEYGFPWPNVTGIVEVSPMHEMLQQAVQAVGRPERVVYVAANTPTAWKNFVRLRRGAESLGIDAHALMADDMAQFETHIVAAQDDDILVLGSDAGIAGWDAALAGRLARDHTDAFSVTTLDWMMPYAMLGLTKLPEEQGEWVGESAIAILDGRAPSTIPLATNRRWEIWVNEDLLERGGYELPANTLRKARHALRR